MHLKEYEPIEPRFQRDQPVQEAQENLRVIRDLMERSTKYSTFSGLSGVLAGLVAITGCLIQYFYVLALPLDSRNTAFLINWSIVIILAIGFDFLLTKRRAPQVGKTIVSRLGKQMALAALPGLGTGALLSLVLLHHGLMDQIYPFWMLCYGAAVCAVGLFSQREVTRLGWAFVGTGAVTLLLHYLSSTPQQGALIGLIMTGIAFGGFHIVYGIVVSRRGGW
jgi:hypothetical protein